ncbi:hypothetical protein [Streptomyces sp. NPDC001970]
MQRRALKTVLATAGAALAVAVSPFTAHAAPFQGGNYGAYAYEGSYPTISACAGTFSLKFQRSFEGITLKYFYSGKCGSFARIENARTNCAAVAQRSNGSVARVDGWASETVDPGINYAYTKIANNLSGKVSRAVLVCDGHELVNTPWY